MTEQMRKKFLLGRRLWGIFCFAFSLMLGIHFYAVSQTFTSATDPFFTSDQLWSAPQKIEFTSRLPNENIKKVVFLVLDGLRYDFTQTHPQLSQFVTSISADSKLLKLHCQLPSVSNPNWATLISSAPPEWTGIVANDEVPFLFDTIAERALEANIPMAVAALDEWGFLLRKSLQPFHGDGMVPWNSVLEDPSQFTIRHAPFNAHDELTAKRLYSAIQSGTFDFIFGYFADIDARSHQWGAISDPCYSAVANKTKILTNIVNMLDNDTVLVITADHGHVDQGGHGGTSASVMEIPLILYKKGSNWKSKEKVENSYSFAEFSDYATNLDVAPSIAALLGIAVPVEAKGVYLDDVLQIIDSKNVEQFFKNLYEQKKYLATMVYDVMGGGIPEEISGLQDPETMTGGTSLQRCTKYRDNILKIMEVINTSRETDFGKRMGINITIIALVGFIFVLTSTMILQQFSLCNFTDIYLGSKELMFKLIAKITKKNFFTSLDQQFNVKTVNSIMNNTTAFWFTFLLFLTHPLECLGIFFLIFRFWRQDWHWDFSMFDSAFDAYVYIGILNCIGVGVTLVNVHIFHWWCLKSKGEGIPIIKQISCYVSSKEKWYVEKLVVARHYFCLLMMLLGWIIFSIAGSNFILLPSIAPVQWIGEWNWNIKFRLFGVLCFYLPSVIMSALLTIYFFPTSVSYNLLISALKFKLEGRVEYQDLEEEEGSLYSEELDDYT